ncbi:MAG: nitronate monooxygenase [Gemmatimonadota bacterium]
MHRAPTSFRTRAEDFCKRFELGVPILLAPMAGVSAPELSIAVANAGGMGACGAVLMQPDEILGWATTVRDASNGRFQLNLWIPDPPPRRDADHEARVRSFLASWGPPVPPEAGDATLPDFTAQCDALLEARPPVVSSVMGVFPPEYVARVKALGIAWFAIVSTLAEAQVAAAAGANAIVVQGAEAGGHRAAFHADRAERDLVGLFSLLPAVVDSVDVPVVAAGGIADARGVAAAFALGASAVAIGTGFLRCPEAKIHPAWANALRSTPPESTIISRAFSGRAGRSIATAYVRAALDAGAPLPAPYPVQRALTTPMRAAAAQSGDIDSMLAWAGQSAALARDLPAGELVHVLWEGAQEILA